MTHRGDSGVKIQMLKLIKDGVGRMSNITSFSNTNWIKGKKLIDELIDGGYIELFDGRVVLTEKGKKFVSYVDEYIDFFTKDLNSYFRYG